MIHDEHYTAIASEVVTELRQYAGEPYAAPFVDDVAVSRLGVAIQ